MARQDKAFIKAMREALAANDDLRAHLREIGEDVLQTAKAIAPEDSGDFINSLQVRHTKYRKLGKTTRVARIVSTLPADEVNSIVNGRGADQVHGATPKHDTWNRTAAAYNSPADEDE